MLAVLRRSVEQVCSAHLLVIEPVGNKANFEKMSERWQAAGNTVSDLIGPRFEPQP